MSESEDIYEDSKTSDGATKIEMVVFSKGKENENGLYVRIASAGEQELTGFDKYREEIKQNEGKEKH